MRFLGNAILLLPSLPPETSEALPVIGSVVLMEEVRISINISHERYRRYLRYTEFLQMGLDATFSVALDEWPRFRNLKDCLHCHRVFQANLSTQQYCSKQCRWAGQKKRQRNP